MSNDSPWVSNDPRTALNHAGTTVKRGARSIWAGFVEFALRDNVLEIAVGLMYVSLSLGLVASFSGILNFVFRIAASFTAVVKSLVSDIILPPFSLLPFVSANIEEKFLTLKKGHGSTQKFNTRAQAIEDGAVILSYGYALSLFTSLDPRTHFFEI